MTDLELEAMELAIMEASACDWPEEHLDRKPKVGAVITIGDKMIACAHRVEELHAERIALERVPNVDLRDATVFTTLEPCTRTVRRREGDSCTERLISRHPKKDVIGMLDPNQGVCGKGVLELQDHDIEVALFPHKMAGRIRDLNERFIRAQKTLGIKITDPRDGDLLAMGHHKIRGIFTNPPTRDVFAMTYVEPNEATGTRGGWWPQESVRRARDAEDAREATVQFGSPRDVVVHIVRANELGRELVDFYEQLKEIRKQVIWDVASLYCRDPEDVRRNIAPSFWSLPMSSSPPKGLDIQDSVKIRVAE
jgi:pyrimidine deaminase RibD-like protein